MLGLLDNDGPPPKFTFSSLIALLAAVATFCLEVWVIVQVIAYPIAGALFGWMLVVVLLPVPILLTIILCAIAVYFGPRRWGVIGGLLIFAPMVFVEFYVVIALLTR